ncbi:50S ribosomal protein L29 [Patescibacteria group bacterium]|nr:50S ribosomal protein L29 [Patescibacteria group bacterium]
MKAAELRAKKPADLQKLRTEYEAEARAIRFGTSSGGSKNVKKLRAIKKDIARIITILRPH